MSSKCDLNGAALSETGLCTTCRKKCAQKCDRCGDFYCSEDCQRKDWSNHRYICFPMPKLIKVGQTLSNNNNGLKKDVQLQHESGNSSITINLPPNGSCVLLTALKSTNIAFIRSTIPTIIKEYEKILNQINDAGLKSSALTEKPKNNSHALTTRNGKWYRVEIQTQMRDGLYRVAFTDLGETSNRSFKELRKCDPALINLPNFLHKVHLKGVANFPNQKILRSLSKYINKEYRIEFVEKDKTGGNVELFQWGSTILLNSLIQDMCNKDKNIDADHVSVSSSTSNVELPKNQNADKKDEPIKSSVEINKTSLKKDSYENSHKQNDKKVVEDQFKNKDQKNENGLPSTNASNQNRKIPLAPRQIQGPCLKPPFDIIPLNEDDQKSRIMIMDNSYIESGFIGCLLEKYYENLKAVTKFLHEYNIGDQPYKPKCEEYCLANFDNEWYRAKVVEIISEDKFLVVYIDFTNEKELSSEFIRRYPMSLDLPCCTTLCAIDGIPEELSDELKKFLDTNFTPFNILNIDNIRKEKNIIYVKSIEILNKIRESKLI